VTTDSTASLQALLTGQYLIERELGRGGMGVVYLARDVRLDRPVAIKVLPRALAADPELRERFLREARTSAQLSHPNIVPIYRADEIDGVAFFTMGFVDGETLAERLRARGPLPPAEAVRMLREAAWALASAHARGVVHRDVKPENIMIERGSNRAVVTDFGIAQNQLATPMTQGGMVLGSVHYMSPEQAAGDALDGRSDLYSLGVVGFQILSGRLPFDAAAAGGVKPSQE
jgi:serine/threonine-protein kinase